MALTVEDGTGLSNSDSYLSVADADAYFLKHGNPSAWDDIKATGVLHLPATVTDGDTVTIGATTYTFRTNAPSVDGEILIGADEDESLQNLHAGILNDLDIVDGASGKFQVTGANANTGVASRDSTAKTLTLEASTSGTVGNAIGTTATFTNLANHFEATTLLGGGDQKEESLRLATQYLDNMYAQRWRGRRKEELQALAWPRVDVEDFDGLIVDSDSLPQKLEDATAEASLRNITESDGLFPDLANQGFIKSQFDKIDVLATKTEFAGAGGSPTGVKSFRIIDALLSSLIFLSGRLARG